MFQCHTRHRALCYLMLISPKPQTYMYLYNDSYILQFVCRTAKSNYVSASSHVCPSVRIEYLGFHWTDFHEI